MSTTMHGVIAAAIVLNVTMWAYLALGQREIRAHLRRQHRKLHQHSRAIVHLQSTAPAPARSTRQPMASVTAEHRAVQADLRRAIAAGGWTHEPLWGREDGPEAVRPVEPRDPQSGTHTAGAPQERQEGAIPGGKSTLQPTDPTTRLRRPPTALRPTTITEVLAAATRPLTATEIASVLDRKPWDLLPDIDQAMAAGQIRTVSGHTAGRTAYAIADTTTRLPEGSRP